MLKRTIQGRGEPSLRPETKSRAGLPWKTAPTHALQARRDRVDFLLIFLTVCYHSLYEWTTRGIVEWRRKIIRSGSYSLFMMFRGCVARSWTRPCGRWA